MATLPLALRQVKETLESHFPSDRILEISRNLGHVRRKRVLTPEVTDRLFLLQLLAGVAMKGLRHVAGVTVSAQAIRPALDPAGVHLSFPPVRVLINHRASSITATGDGASGGK